MPDLTDPREFFRAEARQFLASLPSLSDKRLYPPRRQDILTIRKHGLLGLRDAWGRGDAWPLAQWLRDREKAEKFPTVASLEPEHLLEGYRPKSPWQNSPPKANNRIRLEKELPGVDVSGWTAGQVVWALARIRGYHRQKAIQESGGYPSSNVSLRRIDHDLHRRDGFSKALDQG